ncbi:hypothetical protein BGZ98_000648 [Dissophora globulifera]|nr:hypothetical protein BGZ98_000648 [Dissophora globulifera]
MDSAPHHDQSNGSLDSYHSSSSAASSKHASPAPSTRSESTRGSPTPKSSKGKLFQCTGFGDCRMVFTRSEHLARHARKHTGEKPFQCVVDGCTRMFSRFDNMVQHTQTHTKGARRESAAGIASKIAAESRRKSEAGLLGPSSSGGRVATKTSKSKRGSTSSISGSEAQQAAASAARKHRIQSMPMVENMTLLTAAAPASDPYGRERTTSSSRENGSSRNRETYESSFRAHRGSSNRIPKKSLSTSDGAIDRRGSVGSATSSSSTLSWYASKLHHRSHLDMSPYGRHQEHLDSHLPPLNLGQYEYAMDHPSAFGRRRPRHPLSPDRSSHSDEEREEDEDEDEEDSDDKEYKPAPSIKKEISQQQQQWGGMVDSLMMTNCTLPPLRSPTDAVSRRALRLPSISSTSLGYRSRSISFEYHNDGSESNVPGKIRRLSLADLETPIYATKKVVDHSIQAQQAPYEGVDVSEDEIHALEAFGELWSQGRDVGADEVPSHSQPQPQVQRQSRALSALPSSVSLTDSSCSSASTMSLPKDSIASSEFEEILVVPGLDNGRRSPRLAEDIDFSRVHQDAKVPLAPLMEMGMDLD